jgi:hypothetical protein
MKYSKGVMWLDDCRIPFVDEVMDFDKLLPTQDGGTIYGGGKGFYRTEPIKEYNQQGRFTPNLLVCDDMLNDGIITKGGVNTSNGDIRKSTIVGAEKGSGFYRPDYYVNRNNINDKGSNSRYYNLDKWFDKIIDEIQ